MRTAHAPLPFKLKECFRARGSKTQNGEPGLLSRSRVNATNRQWRNTPLARKVCVLVFSRNGARKHTATIYADPTFNLIASSSPSYSPLDERLSGKRRIQ